jgi:hypothetical protein
MSFQELFTRSTENENADSHRRAAGIRAIQRLRDRERGLWAVVVVAMALDVLLTAYGLSIGLQEMNPIARRALDVAGAFGLVGLKLTALAVGLCCCWLVPGRYRPVVPLGLALPSLAAVGINAALIALVFL